VEWRNYGDVFFLNKKKRVREYPIGENSG